MLLGSRDGASPIGGTIFFCSLDLQGRDRVALGHFRKADALFLAR
jgi:hypothetical protein